MDLGDPGEEGVKQREEAKEDDGCPTQELQGD
eukprot:CAMPEP_0194772016 /NCGR_PEP_ID=MMETSP0323_2-20130528/50754_1 /TAXON_ID=2866 ORGANISM="Crypthecodinium cohnii, Strain Seligo" /NCGR_SAMPLE_ID=MMETSP0323_2 /ASSEMBLY_ACC=CAM_ASM_000346 /LENGTH=31 /DNA_ID= /DNA_START= /DNA_END= /DNA_ORIENTATION=